MKKIITVLTSFILIITMSACGISENKNEADKSSKQTTQSEQNKLKNQGKTLVVYFSLPETTDPENMNTDEANSSIVLNGEVIGNTQYVANVIQEQTQADIFRIEKKTQYPSNHDTLVDVAKKEQSNNARPELKGKIDTISQYDTIFIGYPTWWSDMPMVLYSFFDEYDLSGKTLIPFNTHGGSGLVDTIDTIAKLEPDATIIENGFSVSRDTVEDAKNDIIKWLEELKLE